MLYDINSFNVSEFIHSINTQKRKKGNPSTKNTKFKYKDIVAAFDIETTNLKIGEHEGSYHKIIDDYIAIMYIWQFQLGKDVTIIGREWKDFLALMKQISQSIDSDERLVIYVHNLSFEFQFIRDIEILGRYINERSVFCVKSRTPVKFLCFDDKIEFRCSYIHSNMSLDVFTDKMDVEHKKLSGDEFDYSKKRYPWTPLTEYEINYCINDVQGLVECIYKEMEVDGDNLYTIPLTSTGYVRRDIRAAVSKLSRDYVKMQLPSYDTYLLLRQAFRGGNTHANRFYAGRRIDGVIYCYDISSSYPNVMINCKFPVKPFRPVLDELDTDRALDMIKRGRALLMKVGIKNLRLLYEFWGCPYIPKDKCRNIVNAKYDNGRILSADYLEITITDVDLRIILDEYDYDEFSIIECMFSTYGYIPDKIREVIIMYFKFKTELKNILGSEILYMKSKNKLNAIYGMTAQNPVKLEEVYINGMYNTGLYYKSDNEEVFLSEENALAQNIDILQVAHSQNIDKSVMPYQWGVWCTAWARERLERAVKLCGDNFLYCDTDSVYVYGNIDVTAYNKSSVNDSKKNGAHATDSKGKTYYMGTLELDKYCTSFKTLGAKKYAYIDNTGLHITISGVNKKKGAEELQRKAGGSICRDGLDLLDVDFIFEDAGGTESIYNDTPMYMTIDGVELYIPTNIAIVNSTYTVSLSEDYSELIEFLHDNDLFGLYRRNYIGAYMESIDI